MEKKKHYLVYQITNTVNGKIYIGKHETFDPDDGYMGSGKLIRRAQAKYGLENFTKTILFDFETEEEMNAKERELVNEEFIARKDTYNIMLGGCGGFSYAAIKLRELLNDADFKRRWLESINNVWKNPVFRNEMLLKQRTLHSSEEWRQKMSLSKLKFYETHPGSFKGKHHTEDTKLKISRAHKQSGHSQGESNPAYGSAWWKDPNDKTKSVVVHKGELPPEGWVRGRWCFGGSKMTKTCPHCGSVGLVGESHCKYPEICAKYRIFTTLIQYFGMDATCVGTERLYDEFFRIKQLIYGWLVDEKMTVLDIVRRVKYPHRSRQMKKVLRVLFDKEF